ncbi:MAG: class III poly(R)-hydroxyalkanoic acid synthase subunit PhaC [Chloroflexi bacterium]|nr:MAG: class III poly(R)-hydroxyalkanoic acid synthase subunit PhaC [Chloroflexota bacterium]
MNPFPVQISPEQAAQELLDYNTKVVQGLQALNNLTEDEIQVGCSEKEEVYREDKLVLYRFKSLVEQPFETPLLIVYALVNRPYMADLQENRSLIRNLLKLGLDVYLIDWGYPGREDRWLTLDDYINGYIDNCVDEVCRRHGLEHINLLGICQGGVFSMCYTALHPEKIKNLVTMVAPVDFHVDGSLLNTWTCGTGPRQMEPDLMVEALGNIPGDFMNFGFLMLKPFQLNLQKYAALANIMHDEAKLTNFLRMEKWIFDSPDQAGEAWRDFIKQFYQGNKLVKGEVQIGGQTVNLKNITQPVLNVYAEQDHLVPPASSMALEDLVGSNDYTAQSFPTGHIGMYVSGKVQRDLPPTIADWLKER